MIIDRIRNISNINSNKVAYKIDKDSITYGELYNKIEKYSEFLSNNGTSPVIIYADKSIDYLVIMLSCIKAKRAYVPIGLCTPLERLKRIINITKSSLVITDKKLDINDVEVVKLNKIEEIKKNNQEQNTNEIAYIIFTSGSTGEPKGVQISYDNLNNFINWISSLKPLDEYRDINVLNQASFSFDLSVADIYYSLFNGHTLVSYSDNYEDFYDVIKNNNINAMFITPTFMRLCLVDSIFNENNFPSLKCIYFCGELLDIKLVKKIYERFPNISIINAYGPTEATSAVSGILINKDMLNSNLLPVGSIENAATEIEIINDEVILKGKSVFKGYLNNIKGGFYIENGINCYKTGDIGYIKDDLLYVKGRIDSQIKYKGYRIELGDIEYNINKIVGVKECAVIAIYDDNNMVKTIKAFVVLESQDYNEEYIYQELKKLIPSYMIPKTIKIIENIPVTCNEKIDRKALLNL